MVRWTLALLTLVTIVPWSRSRRDHLPDPEFTYGADLGHEIHPNRHRHHAHDIYIAGFFPTSPGHAETSIGQGVMPAVKLALHDVNRSPTILPNHHLRMHWNNTAVSSKFNRIERESRAGPVREGRPLKLNLRKRSFSPR